MPVTRPGHWDERSLFGARRGHELDQGQVGVPHAEDGKPMQIGLLVTNLRELEESTDWDFDYLEGFPGLLGIDADDPQTEREFSALLEKHPLQMKTMCGFIPDPQGRGLMVVGPDVSLDRLRTFVTRVFDLHANGPESRSSATGAAARAGCPTASTATKRANRSPTSCTCAPISASHEASRSRSNPTTATTPTCSTPSPKRPSS